MNCYGFCANFGSISMYYSVFRDVLVGYQSEYKIRELGLGKAATHCGTHSSAIWANFELVFSIFFSSSELQGTGDTTKTNEFSEKLQTAIDPPLIL